MKNFDSNKLSGVGVFGWLKYVKRQLRKSSCIYPEKNGVFYSELIVLDDIRLFLIR